VKNFKLPPLGGEWVSQNPTIQEMLASKISFRPQVDQSLCTGCGTCVDQCPVSALEIVDVFPEVDADTCITCFCCQELCPEKAIQLG